MNPLTEWEAFKTTLRGTFMFITGILLKNTQQHTVELKTAMTSAETAYASNPTPTNRDTWLQCRRGYELCLLDLTQKRMLHTTQTSFEHGNKPGLLAYLTRPEHSPVSILWIMTAQGQISDAPRDIMETFLLQGPVLVQSRIH